MKKAVLAAVMIAMVLFAVGMAQEEEKQVFTSGDYQYILMPENDAEIMLFTI